MRCRGSGSGQRRTPADGCRTRQAGMGQNRLQQNGGPCLVALLRSSRWQVQDLQPPPVACLPVEGECPISAVLALIHKGVVVTTDDWYIAHIIHPTYIRPTRAPASFP